MRKNQFSLDEVQEDIRKSFDEKGKGEVKGEDYLYLFSRRFQRRTWLAMRLLYTWYDDDRCGFIKTKSEPIGTRDSRSSGG